MSDPAVEVPGDPPAKGPNKIMPIILVVNTLMITGVLIFVMKRPSAQASNTGKEHAASAEEHGEKAEKSEKPAKHEKAEHGEHGEKEGKSEGHGEEGDSEGAGPILKLESFIVQIRAPEGDRYVHMTLEMELGVESDKKPFEARMPKVRDLVIAYLSDRTEDELRGSEGLAQVKEALLKKLDEVVPGHRIHALFVTEFIIQ